jgi:hypothetical protein
MRRTYPSTICLDLPPYELAYEPLPPDGRKAGREHSLQRTVMLFLESGEPSARVVGLSHDGTGALTLAIQALRAELQVRNVTRQRGVYLVRL